MATTRNNVIHKRKDKSTSQCITDRVNYALNGEKTWQGELVTSYECSPEYAAEEFLLSKQEYFDNTGRDQGDRDILLYHVRQSFRPGEVVMNFERSDKSQPSEKGNFELNIKIDGSIDLDTANKIGYDLAMEFCGGNHQFLIATHTDTAHIHNAIIINSVNLNCDGKFRNEIGSYKRLRAISDELCNKHGLSVIKNPELSKGFGHGTIPQEGEKGPSERQKLMTLIDEIIASGNAKNLDDFLSMIKESECTIKVRGKSVSVKMKGAKRFIRLRETKSLPSEYSLEGISKRISEKPAPISIKQGEKVNLLIDIQNSIKAQNSPGYENWAKVFNLKQAAQTLIFLQENNIADLQTLTDKAQQVKGEYDIITDRIQAIDSRLADISTLQKHIGSYLKTKDIYSQYLKSKRNKNFYEENRTAIETCNESKAYFNELGLEKLPSIKSLKNEYAALASEKQMCYSQRSLIGKQLKEMQSVQQNTENLLDYQHKEKSIATKKREDVR